MDQATIRYAIFDTVEGHCAIAWGESGVRAFQLPMRSAAAAERSLLHRVPGARRGQPAGETVELVDAARSYFAGERVDFSRARVDLGPQDDFFARIYAATRRLGWGEATTYGALAKQLGAGPEAARDVGAAMARNPVPLIVPCHRVLAAGGKPGGFSAPGGTATKLRMLALEGVQVGPPPPAQQSLPL